METKQTSTPAGHPVQEAGNGLSRRKFLCKTCGCAAAGAAAAPVAGLAWGEPIEIGKLSDFAQDEISEKFAQQSFFVIRYQGKLYASTVMCPHENNSLFRSSGNPLEIECSGHQSIFDAEGRPVSGEADEALKRFGIAVDEKGVVRVDTGKHFAEEQWEDPASFVVIEAAS